VATSIATSKYLEATYVSVVVDIVREADEDRLKGREMLKDRTSAQRKVGMLTVEQLKPRGRS
jgi:hypothetical protein